MERKKQKRRKRSFVVPSTMISKPANNGSTFSAVSTPHFFTVILQNTLRDNTLLIPVKFVRRYGETLSNPVSVKLPCGSEWKMELRKFDGRVCLHKGWPEFVKHYSIALGHFLVFRYEGNSRFHAFIFDKTTVEIDYPLNPSHYDASNGEDIKEDESVEILENCSPRPGKRKGSPLPFSQPHKKFRASPIGETKSKRTRSNEKIIGNSMRNREGQHSKSMKGKFQVSAEKGRQSEVETSTCKVVIKSTNVGEYYDMRLPWTFASEIFKKQSLDGVLVISDGRSWPVEFRRRSRNEIRRGFRLLKEGWKKFADDNNLKVGDTCVFQLIDGNKKSFKVSILKADSDSHPSHAGERRTNLFKLKRNVEVKTLFKGNKLGNSEYKDRTSSLVMKMPPSLRNPCFKVQLPKSCVKNLHVPKNFAAENFEPETQIVKLKVGKETWEVKTISFPGRLVFSGGWSAFARANNLRWGMFCSFELVGREHGHVQFKVTISEPAASYMKTKV